jgi:hypothetical protein
VMPTRRSVNWAKTSDLLVAAVQDDAERDQPV